MAAHARFTDSGNLAAVSETLRSSEPETHLERRACRRVEVTCQATLQTMTTNTCGHLCDMSEAGARFVASEPPGAGATALLKWSTYEAVCTIVWSEGEACGLAFRQPLPRGVVEETAAINRVVELPIASVGNIVQGRRRSLPFRNAKSVLDEEPTTIGPVANVFAGFRRR